MFLSMTTTEILLKIYDYTDLPALGGLKLEEI
jgi:hypothetical protein